MSYHMQELATFGLYITTESSDTVAVFLWHQNGVRRCLACAFGLRPAKPMKRTQCQYKVNIAILKAFRRFKKPNFRLICVHNIFGAHNMIDGWLRMGLLPPPREFCRHILSCRELKAEAFKRCLHSVLRGVSL